MIARRYNYRKEAKLLMDEYYDRNQQCVIGPHTERSPGGDTYADIYTVQYINHKMFCDRYLFSIDTLSSRLEDGTTEDIAWTPYYFDKFFFIPRQCYITEEIIMDCMKYYMRTKLEVSIPNIKVII